MIHMKLNIQSLLSWGIRLVGTYLFFWWAAFSLALASLEPLTIRDIVIGALFGGIHSFTLFISTLKYPGKIKRIIVGTCILLGFINYLYSLINTVHYIYILGVVFHSVAIHCFIKLNFRRGREMINIKTLKTEAEREAYDYFNKNIRPLVMKEKGEIDLLKNTLFDTDIDAFRHAYVSGVFTLELDANKAAFWGWVNEVFPGGGSSGQSAESSKNMDYWNNEVGRKYGKQAKSKRELAEFLKKALENGELIISLDDPRKFGGETSFQFDSNKPVIVLKESETGRNELFCDLSNGTVFDRESFASAIKDGEYPGYLIASIDGLATPMSKPDDIKSNNLG